MQNVISFIAEVELERFSVNDYRGLADAPPFSVTDGKLPVMVAATHSSIERM